MPFRKILCVAVVLMVLVGGMAHGQEAETPLYRFAYAVQGPELRVVTYIPLEDRWQMDRLNARALFGDADLQLVLPEWTSDGQALVTSVLEPNSTVLATRLFRYMDGTFEPVLNVLEPDTLEAPFEYIRIDSISPDGRYAWTTRLISFETQLIDLDSGDVIVQASSCPARVLAWLPDEVIVSCNGTLFNEPNIFGINLSTGEEARVLLPPPGDSAESIVTGGQVLPGNRMVVGAFGSEQASYAGVISLGEFSGDYVGPGSYLSLNASGDTAAFFADGRIFRWDLATARVSDLGEALPVADGVWQNDELHFWKVNDASEELTLTHVVATPLSRSERIIYQGARPLDFALSPYGAFAALEFQPAAGESFVELHGREGLVWVSDFDFPGSFVGLQLFPDRPIMWSPTGEWVHLRFSEDATTAPRTMSLNLRDVDFNVFAPEERTSLVSESPDGVWWLYATTSDPYQPLERRLFAYRPRDAKLQIISEAPPLYSSFQFPDWNFYIWAPQ